MIYKGKDIKISNNKYVNDRIVIKDLQPHPKDSNPNFRYNCDICRCEYSAGGSIRNNYRKICSKHHFYYVCDYCGKEFEIIRLSDFIASDKNLRFCSHNCALQYRNRTPEMRKAVVKMNNSRAKENLNKIQVCKKCGRKFQSVFPMDICNGCITSETNKKNAKQEQICKKCGKPFYSPFIMKIGPCCNPNLPKLNFITKDNVSYYYDQSTNDYIPWEEYKKKFITKKVNVLPDEFELVPTFRTQDSEDWNGSKRAFEQNLVDEGIGWFIYVKFYINRTGEIKPLVCGKTGSLNVNTVGTDVIFDYDINSGPARKFLIEEGLEWDKTQIAILRCKSEEEAYENENYYINKLDLFQS